jgi:hypothetical protein
MASRLALEATHSNIISTLIHEPWMQGLPPRTAGTKKTRVNMSRYSSTIIADCGPSSTPGNVIDYVEHSR